MPDGANDELKVLCGGNCGGVKASDLILSQEELEALSRGEFGDRVEAIAFEVSQTYWRLVRPQYVVQSCVNFRHSSREKVKDCIRAIGSDGARADFWHRFLAIQDFIFQLNLASLSEITSKSVGALAEQLSRILAKQKESIQFALEEARVTQKLNEEENALSKLFSKLSSYVQSYLVLDSRVRQIASEVFGSDINDSKAGNGQSLLEFFGSVSVCLVAILMLPKFAFLDIRRPFYIIISIGGIVMVSIPSNNNSISNTAIMVAASWILAHIIAAIGTIFNNQN